MNEKIDIDNEVLHYEKFINDVLKEDLKKILQLRDEIYAKIAEYLQLQTMVEKLEDSNISFKNLKTKVDLGCNFYVPAVVPDASKIYVQVGLGFFVGLTLVETIKFIEKKIKLLNTSTDQLTKDAAKIRANIKVVLEGLREIQNISENPDVPQRFLWN